MWVINILFVLHILCCIFAVIGILCGIIKVHKYMIPVVVLLPIWGLIIMLILHFSLGFNDEDFAEIDIEKLRIESEAYKSITIDDKKNADTIVPIEEALIVNSARERREIIMDVLNDDPKEYIEFLQKAGNNDDTEVVHYAVTAMVEISKENDFTLQSLETAYRKNPDDYDAIKNYCDFLWNCLEQNLMQGQVLLMNRNLFDELARKKIGIKAEKEDYIRIIKNDLYLESYAVAGSDIEMFEAEYPKSEELIMLKFQYYSSLGRGEDIKAMIKELEKKELYLSARIREAMVFWKE